MEWDHEGTKNRPSIAPAAEDTGTQQSTSILRKLDHQFEPKRFKMNMEGSGSSSKADCNPPSEENLLPSEPSLMRVGDHVIDKRHQTFNGELNGYLINMWPKPARSIINRNQNHSAVAKLLATNLISEAKRFNKGIEDFLVCCDCGLLPIQPVTAGCGHTKCHSCYERNRICFCGEKAEDGLLVNQVIQDIITQIISHDKQSQPEQREPSICRQDGLPVLVASRTIPRPPQTNNYHFTMRNHMQAERDLSVMAPMSSISRLYWAFKLIENEEFYEAVLHLIWLCTTSTSRNLLLGSQYFLVSLLDFLRIHINPDKILSDYGEMIRRHSPINFIDTLDLECILCSDKFVDPITIKCGHTYCRVCLDKCMDYHKRCSLCLRPLLDFDICKAKNTEFIMAISIAAGIKRPALPFNSVNITPIVICTTALPGVPCPTYLNHPSYYYMIRQVLRSPTRTFGMIPNKTCKYGTLIEIRDSILMEDGSYILSTIGVSRFKILHNFIYQGCDSVHYETLEDNRENVNVVLRLSYELQINALDWLLTMKQHRSQLFEEIEVGFGPCPLPSRTFGTRYEPDGPMWIWWLTSVLPLDTRMKVPMLCTKSLIKRMKIVLRTLKCLIET